MRKIGFIFSLLTSLSLTSVSADTLDEALNRLDRAGSQFKGMSAKFTQVKYTAIVDEPSKSKGEIKIKKRPPNDILGIA